MNIILRLSTIVFILLCSTFQCEIFASEKKSSTKKISRKSKIGTITKLYTFNENICDDKLLHFAIYCLEDGYSLMLWGNKPWNLGDKVTIDKPFSKKAYDHDNSIKVTNQTTEKNAELDRLGFTTLELNYITNIDVCDIDDETSVVISLDDGTICTLNSLGSDKIPASTWQVGEKVALFIDLFTKNPYKTYQENTFFIEEDDECEITIINLDSKQHFLNAVDTIEIQR